MIRPPKSIPEENTAKSAKTEIWLPFQNTYRTSFIDYNGGIEVHSSLLNVVLHDEPHINI